MVFIGTGIKINGEAWDPGVLFRRRFELLVSRALVRSTTAKIAIPAFFNIWISVASLELWAIIGTMDSIQGKRERIPTEDSLLVCVGIQASHGQQHQRHGERS
jgi:hypothetical protein